MHLLTQYWTGWLPDGYPDSRVTNRTHPFRDHLKNPHFDRSLTIRQDPLSEQTLIQFTCSQRNPIFSPSQFQHLFHCCHQPFHCCHQPFHWSHQIFHWNIIKLDEGWGLGLSSESYPAVKIVISLWRTLLQWWVRLTEMCCRGRTQMTVPLCKSLPGTFHPVLLSSDLFGESFVNQCIKI